MGGDISREQWQQRWEEMKNCNSTYYVIVIEDTTVAGGLIIGAASMVMERKFIHSCGSVGRLEDVVVSDQYRYLLHSVRIQFLISDSIEASNLVSLWFVLPHSWQSSWA